MANTTQTAVNVNVYVQELTRKFGPDGKKRFEPETLYLGEVAVPEAVTPKDIAALRPLSQAAAEFNGAECGLVVSQPSSTGARLIGRMTITGLVDTLAKYTPGKNVAADARPFVVTRRSDGGDWENFVATDKNGYTERKVLFTVVDPAVLVVLLEAARQAIIAVNARCGITDESLNVTAAAYDLQVEQKRRLKMAERSAGKSAQKTSPKGTGRQRGRQTKTEGEALA